MCLLAFLSKETQSTHRLIAQIMVSLKGIVTIDEYEWTKKVEWKEKKNKKFHQHIEHLSIVDFEYEDYTILKPMMDILIEYSAIWDIL